MDSSLCHPFRTPYACDILRESIVPQAKGTLMKMHRILHDILNTFSILNSGIMRQWLERFEEAKSRWLREWAQLAAIDIFPLVMGGDHLVYRVKKSL